ncbi:MAG TPA: DUF1028 domain-containing protein [Beijerinckiaceae bacterium]
MTWSIIARDASGAIGIAVSTKFFAVGARVPTIEAGVGAVASQALTNPLYGRRGLALLRLGVPAADVVRLLIEADAGHPHRQVHVMDGRGNFAAHTGAECVDWCGHLIRENFSVAGNMLAGPQVIAETARAYEAESALPFPRRLIAALKAGEDAGGDKRGKQSAALLIFSTEEYSDLDLRVDDHPEPIDELARLEKVSRERWVHFRKFLPSRANPAGVTDRAVIDAGVAAAIAAEGDA